MEKMGRAMSQTNKADDFRVFANRHQPILLLEGIYCRKATMSLSERHDQTKMHPSYQHPQGQCP